MGPRRAARADDVRALVRAAREVVAQREAILPAIVESTGLSAEGVELALTRHVETEPSDEEIERLVERAGRAPRVTVILSANVFVGALRAVALARAASEDVVVRPSRRDPTFARALVAAVGDRRLCLDEALDVAAVDTGEIHVYGRDETIGEVRARARVGVRGHGSGMGIAWVSRSANLEEAARGLAEDVVVFDQRGCLSPRVALVEGEPARSDAFAEALHEALEQLGGAVPRGSLPAQERATSGRYVATMMYACRALVGEQHAIGIAAEGAPLVLPPPYRHVHVAACRSVEEARAALEPFKKGIIAVGSDDADRARAIAPTWARLSALGSMQRPPLDGPVDLRS